MSDPSPVPRAAIPRQRRPDDGPVLYDWAVEVPEWRPRPAPSSALAGLPELPLGGGAGAGPGPDAAPAGTPGGALPAEPGREAAAERPAGGERAVGLAPRTAAALRGRWAALGRRGRVAVLSLASVGAGGALSLAVLTSAAAGASASESAAGAAFGRGPSPTVVVRDGDTLWGIAEQARPGEDVRRTVHAIVELNDLRGPHLRPGQELRLPAR
ncbi:LysM peptidoglycan-binding domain-containing protein [Nocardiopsis suaedae]|uniref:LysM peptidoglycan-binding domain-containing protein n=1 Tax=Nocardiopsis suaedae TaxID=3018444 RepID=A0ABT4TVW8_9ACTN|nr:LysM peptidoglycan-binding domain-containing protein [Nocardiopsis suaedae]MDA2808287.1 LysM peptidoglycan-binding domain-containing protein [Nocardiopsis suaedae]